MEHDFDKPYWDKHWQERDASAPTRHANPPHPYLLREVGDLTPGKALEAGCGEGAEAIWLAQAGWQVTAADIAEEPLARAAARAIAQGLGEVQIRWVQADLSTWQPEERFDLVTTHYAHPAMPQLDFYDRISDWVVPGGTLLIVGHLHHDHGGHHHDVPHENQPPAEATATAERITTRLDPATWDVVTADEHSRTLNAPGGSEVTLHDVVVRAVRRSA